MKEYKKTISNYSLKKNKTDIPACKIKSSKDAYDYFLKFYSDDISIYESFFMITLNRNNIVEGFVKISQGGIAGTVVDVRLICRIAIESLASGIIICHNHPSGNKQPSTSDIEISKKVSVALKMFDIILLDSLIITENSYLSLADEGHI